MTAYHGPAALEEAIHWAHRAAAKADLAEEIDGQPNSVNLKNMASTFARVASAYAAVAQACATADIAAAKTGRGAVTQAWMEVMAQ
jgi:hypothetical protein